MRPLAAVNPGAVGPGVAPGLPGQRHTFLAGLGLQVEGLLGQVADVESQYAGVLGVGDIDLVVAESHVLRRPQFALAAALGEETGRELAGVVEDLHVESGAVEDIEETLAVVGQRGRVLQAAGIVPDAQELAHGVEHDHFLQGGVQHVDVLVLVAAHRHRVGQDEVAHLGSHGEQEDPVRAEGLYFAVLGVGHVNVALGVDRHRGRPLELAVAGAALAEHVGESAVRVEDLHPVVAGIGHIDEALGVDKDAARRAHLPLQFTLAHQGLLGAAVQQHDLPGLRHVGHYLIVGGIWRPGLSR